MLDVDASGLDVMDRKLLQTVLAKFDGGPVGIDNLAAAIGEERDTIEDVLEPFLIQQGFLQRTARGRIATASAYRHFGLAPPTPARPSTAGPLSRVEYRSQSLIEPAFSLPVRVYYEDTDAAGVVYYANYLRFLERARTEWLASLGHPLAELERVHGIVFVVRRIEVDYKLPARLSDALDVTVAIETLGRASLTVQQQVRASGRTLLTRARHARMRRSRTHLKPVRIPIDALDLRTHSKAKR